MEKFPAKKLENITKEIVKIIIKNDLKIPEFLSVCFSLIDTALIGNKMSEKQIKVIYENALLMSLDAKKRNG